MVSCVERLESKIKNILMKNMRSFYTVFIIGLLLNIGQFIYQGGNGDTNVYTMYQPDYGWEISLGRWLIQYVGDIRNDVVIPLWIEILTIAVLAVSLLLILEQLGINRKIYLMPAAFLFMSQPFVTFILHIYYCADAYAVSVFMAVLGSYLLTKKDGCITYISSIFCMVISLSLYQSNIVFTGVLVIMILLFRLFNDRMTFTQNLKDAFKYAMAGVISIFSYIIVLKLYLQYSNIQLADYKGMSKMGQLNISGSVTKYLELMKNMYFMEDGVVGYQYWFHGKAGIICNICFIIFLFVIFIWNFISNKDELGWKNILLGTGYVLLLPLMWGIVVFMAPEVTIHVLIMPHLVLLYIYYLAVLEWMIQRKKGAVLCSMKYIGMLSVIFVIYNFSFLSSQFHYGLKLADNRAYALADEIHHRLMEKDEWEQGMKIAVIGDLDTVSKAPDYYNLYGRTETLFWDGYASQGCWQKYLLERIGVYYTVCSAEEYENLMKSEELLELECFPSKDAVRKVSDVFVVKLGEVH